MYKNRKPLIIGILCTLIVFMAVGFALLSQELTITGTSSIDSNWNIRITNIRVKNLTSAYATGTNASADVSGTTGCTTKTAPCDTTSANFEAKLITPGDSITYEVTITNSGNLDGVVESINLTCSENEAITCTTSGLSRADTISHTSPNNTNTVDVTVTYNSATSTQPASTTSNITLTVNYQQDLGQVVVYPTYSIGDNVTFGGANWKVIKNSTDGEDYVTLMKEQVLTAEEIGDAYSYKGTCTQYDVNNNEYGCTTVGQTVAQPKMAYYWSSTCHNKRTYGIDTYSSSDTSGCSGHDDYAGSKIKQVVDNYMTNYLDESKLKVVDGYRIRLITSDELVANLEYDEDHELVGGFTRTDNVPTWVYSNGSYWTMTPTGFSNSVLVVGSGVRGTSYVVQNTSISVRPVINLLKTAIPTQS